MTQLTFGVLWDMDGVLVDTGEFHFQAWSAALGKRAISFSREQFRRVFGMNNEDTLKFLLGSAFTPELLFEIGEDKEQLFRAAIHGQAQPLPGVYDWLARLQTQGAQQAVASSAPQANIEVLVDELKLRPYFKALVSGTKMPGKPDPAVFLLAARAIAVPPERCVVIEDSIAGVAGAKRAGMKCVAVTTTNPASALTQADLIVERLAELALDAFEQLLY